MGRAGVTVGMARSGVSAGRRAWCLQSRPHPHTGSPRSPPPSLSFAPRFSPPFRVQLLLLLLIFSQATLSIHAAPPGKAVRAAAKKAPQKTPTSQGASLSKQQQAAGQAAAKTTNQLSGKTTSQITGQTAGPPAAQAAGQTAGPAAAQAAGQTAGQASGQAVNQAISHATGGSDGSLATNNTTPVQATAGQGPATTGQGTTQPRPGHNHGTPVAVAGQGPASTGQGATQPRPGHTQGTPAAVAGQGPAGPGTPTAKSSSWLAQVVASKDELRLTDEETMQDRCTEGRKAAEDYIRKWVTSPGPETCGHWQTKFVQLHKDMKTGRWPRQYITFENPNNMPKSFPRPGLGDYLVGMATTFVIGLLSNRSFVMQPSPFTEVVEPGAIDWTPQGHVPMAYGNRAAPVVYLEFFNTLRNEGGWKNSVTVPARVIPFFGKMASAVNIRVATNGGILARIFNDRGSPEYKALHGLGLRLPTAFGCILRFLFRPKAAILGAILPQLEAMLRPAQSVVGIHMRTSDDFAWAGGTDASALGLVLNKTESTVLQCARDFEEACVLDGFKAAWLFLSDSSTLRARVQKQYKDKIIQNDIDPVHPSFNGTGFMAPAFAEWLLFSTCHTFVITESGFSKTSAAYNLKSPRIFLFSHFGKDNATGSCEPSRPSSLLHFTRWSGL